MKVLKECLISMLVLIKINYSKDTRAIILRVDTSLKGYRVVLIQKDIDKKQQAAQYKSRTWNSAERGYDTTKRKC